ncbi:IclR family transcriptional regulator [Halarchaeum nitratireducens]|uniref:IclR family transcriptional regulator n=1 Tax=Halarchaeum nitratireducens TaxID=489913 RepID=A0A830GC54_9EURY|nr:IclR family transcriptional regulator [Halarchaeum nitratireducens]GGN20731.1 IclR family transcriptional regulator [Halarchaeum nitratireducens]
MVDEQKRIQSSERSLTILGALAVLGPATASEIADHLDLARNTMHYHLKTLAHQSYVVEIDGQYRLGMRLLNMGHRAVENLDVYRVGKAKVDELSRQTGELSILMIEENGYGYYVYDAHGDDAVRFDTVGRRKHLHDNALGKAVLAQLPPERVNEILDERGLPETTPHTITDRSTLKAEIDTIRERGVAFDREEQLEGLCCVAAAVENRGDAGADRRVGAISIAGPTSRMSDERLEALAPRVSDAANLIELEMQGY